MADPSYRQYRIVNTYAFDDPFLFLCLLPLVRSEPLNPFNHLLTHYLQLFTTYYYYLQPFL